MSTTLDNSDPYSQFKNIPISVMNMMKEEDKKYHISGPLSYSITYFYLRSLEGNCIELVDTNQLWKYREYSITKKDKENYNTMNRKCKSIKERGFYEPLHLVYYAPTGEAYVDEGNHRLHWAKKNGIKYLPVKVILMHNRDVTDGRKYEKSPNGFIKKFHPKLKYIAPSQIGFNVVKKIPYHPYYPESINSLFHKEITDKNLNNYPKDSYILNLIEMDKMENKDD
jgi:hypothetical protein